MGREILKMEHVHETSSLKRMDDEGKKLSPDIISLVMEFAIISLTNYILKIIFNYIFRYNLLI